MRYFVKHMSFKERLNVPDSYRYSQTDLQAQRSRDDAEREYRARYSLQHNEEKSNA